MDSLEGKLRPNGWPKPSRDGEGEREYQSFLSTLSPLDRMAVRITDKVGSVGFFLLILTWTVLWCGYNVLASKVHALHWRPFDPFPAFVAYLLMSNVIQILLMPLIMVGQNLEAKHTEAQSRRDFRVNKRAETEIRVLEAEVAHVVGVVEALARSWDCEVPARVHHLRHEEDVPVRMSED